jgi:hypothetical protein
MKKPYSFKLDESLLSDLQTEAQSVNRSFNNYVETLLLEHPLRGGGVKKGEPMPIGICRYGYNRYEKGETVAFQDSCKCYNVGDKLSKK